MRRLPFALLLVVGVGCAKHKVDIPPPANYILALPKTDAVWAEQIKSGFEAGCKQLSMNCKFGVYDSDDPTSIAKSVMAISDSAGAPICIVFENEKVIRETLDQLSLASREAITLGRDDSVGFRIGYVGMDAKVIAKNVATRAKNLRSPARRILYLFGDALVDFKALEAAAFRESDDWNAYQLRTKLMSEVTDEDLGWCDLVVPFGEDALKRATDSGAKMIFPTDPTDASLELVKSGRAPFMVADDYFGIGFRASRIARERFVYGGITNPIVLISPREVDKGSVNWYLDKRFDIPDINPAVPHQEKKK